MLTRSSWFVADKPCAHVPARRQSWAGLPHTRVPLVRVSFPSGGKWHFHKEVGNVRRHQSLKFVTDSDSERMLSCVFKESDHV